MCNQSAAIVITSIENDNIILCKFGKVTKKLNVQFILKIEKG